MIKIPSIQDYEQYDGAHCHNLYRQTGPNWRCPACGRSRYHVMRWTNRCSRLKGKYEGWMIGLHKHHDHSVEDINKLIKNEGTRFPLTIICDQCNSADGRIKTKLHLPKNFSFSPSELRQFITPTNHGEHHINYEKAAEVFACL